MAAMKAAARQKRSPRRDSESALVFPAFRPPQLTLTSRVPTGDGWMFELRQLFGLIEIKERPRIKGMPKPQMRVARWVGPQLLVEAQFTEVTPDGQVRHPSFKGIRQDKPARDVHYEEA